jgi:hypothetical protein
MYRLAEVADVWNLRPQVKTSAMSRVCIQYIDRTVG